jgi:hypothetical protein
MESDGHRSRLRLLDNSASLYSVWPLLLAGASHLSEERKLCQAPVVDLPVLPPVESRPQLLHWRETASSNRLLTRNHLLAHAPLSILLTPWYNLPSGRSSKTEVNDDGYCETL